MAYLPDKKAEMRSAYSTFQAECFWPFRGHSRPLKYGR